MLFPFLSLSLSLFLFLGPLTSEERKGRSHGKGRSVSCVLEIEWAFINNGLLSIACRSTHPLDHFLPLYFPYQPITAYYFISSLGSATVCDPQSALAHK